MDDYIEIKGFMPNIVEQIRIPTPRKLLITPEVDRTSLSRERNGLNGVYTLIADFDQKTTAQFGHLIRYTSTDAILKNGGTIRFTCLDPSLGNASVRYSPSTVFANLSSHQIIHLYAAIAYNNKGLRLMTDNDYLGCISMSLDSMRSTGEKWKDRLENLIHQEERPCETD